MWSAIKPIKIKTCVENFLNRIRHALAHELVYFTTRMPGTSDTSATRMTRVLHESYTNGKNATRVKIFGFANGMSENISLLLTLFQFGIKRP